MSAAFVVTVLQLPEAAGGTYDQTLAATLDGVTVAVTQTAGHPQSLSATLDGVTVAVSQTARHPQSLVATLDGVAVAVSQGAGHPQSLAATLDSVAVAITQSKVSTYSQSLSATLDDVVASVSQGAQHPQTVAATLDDVLVEVLQTTSGGAAQLFAGGRRRGYIIRDKKYWLTQAELSAVIGQMVAQPVQQATKKAKRAPTATKQEVRELIALIGARPMLVTEQDVEDEDELLLMLM